MNKSLMVAMGVFTVLATAAIALTIYRSSDRSWLVIANGVALWFVSVLLPLRWTSVLVARLRARDVPIDDLQFILVMPAWCAMIAALTALQLVRR